jgi:hypothetical protein
MTVTFRIFPDAVDLTAEPGHHRIDTHGPDAGLTSSSEQHDDDEGPGSSNRQHPENQNQMVLRHIFTALSK